MTDEQKAIYKRLKKAGKGRAFMTEKERRRIEFMKAGVPDAQDRAFAETIALPEFALAPEAPVTDGEARVAGELSRQSALRELQAAEEAAKQALVKATGQKTSTQKAAIEWAQQWMNHARAGDDRVVRWSRVEDTPPSQSAIAYLEQAALEPGQFLMQLVPKVLGKQQDAGEEWLPAEKKRESELVRMLQEVAAEVKERGADAYA